MPEHDLLKDYPTVYEHKVQWGEMDAFQHVNNIMYIRYFENTRIFFGMQIGIVDQMESKGIGPILASTECKYLKPVFFPDVLLIGIKTAGIQGSEMLHDYKVVSTASNAVAAVGKSLTVFYDYRNNKRVDFPEQMIKRIEEIEGGPVIRQLDV